MAAAEQALSEWLGGEPGPVFLWRFEQLLAAGCADVPIAEGIAGGDADLHTVVWVFQQGCEPETAARIFAPLE